jgi:colanic acid biosynthesis glycosyl transferase WcaI
MVRRTLGQYSKICGFLTRKTSLGPEKPTLNPEIDEEVKASSMKVLIIAQYFPPDMGGGATRAYNVAKGLLRVGCDVTVVSAFPHYPTGNIPRRYRWKPLSTEHESGVKVIRTFVPPLASHGFVKRVLLYASFAFSSLFALPSVGKVDVIWAGNPNIISFYPSFTYAIIKRCPIVQNVDDLWPEALYDLGISKRGILATLGEFLAKIAYKFSSAITPISPAYVDTLTNKYATELGKVLVVPAGVDLDRFSNHGKDVKGENKKFTVLYIGAFSPAYDFDQVFKAADQLTSFSDVEFIIQGGGELAYSLKSKAEEKGLRNVKVVDRIVSREEVAKILVEAEALLLPLSGAESIEMGISSKLYEYQAAGRPIICCSRGQPGRYVSETKSGIVINPGDYQTLAKSILYLKENRALSEQLGESGRQYAGNNMSVGQVGVRMKRVLEQARNAGKTL